MSLRDNFEELSDNLKAYFQTNIKLAKLQALERLSDIGAGIISIIIVTFAGTMFLLFISLWAAFYISSLLGDNYLGFVIVAGFYFLIGLILVIIRATGIAHPIRDLIIRLALQSEDNDNSKN